VVRSRFGVGLRGFTIAGGKVVEMDILSDPDRLSRLDLSAIER
jgi:RNA polymerase sigma-70 factor (ECF subfamily)